MEYALLTRPPFSFAKISPKSLICEIDFVDLSLIKSPTSKAARSVSIETYLCPIPPNLNPPMAFKRELRNQSIHDQSPGMIPGLDFAFLGWKNQQAYAICVKKASSPWKRRFCGRKPREKKAGWRAREPVRKNFIKRKKKAWPRGHWWWSTVTWRWTVVARCSCCCPVSDSRFYRGRRVIKITHKSIKFQKGIQRISSSLDNSNEYMCSYGTKRETRVEG